MEKAGTQDKGKISRFVKVVAVSVLLILCLSGAAFVFNSLTRENAVNAVRINIAGRQRMMTQRIPKEILLFDQGQFSKAELRSTVSLFETNLTSLIEGGRVKYDYSYVSENGDSVPAFSQDTALYRDLIEIRELWHEFKSDLELFLDPAASVSNKQLIEKADRLFLKVDRMVLSIQRYAEQEVFKTRILLIVLLTVIFMLLAADLVKNFVELRRARGRIEKLERIIPMCSSCKKIRVSGDSTENEEWISIEKYLGQSAETGVSHGICRECAKKHYGHLFENGEIP